MASRNRRLSETKGAINSLAINDYSSTKTVNQTVRKTVIQHTGGSSAPRPQNFGILPHNRGAKRGLDETNCAGPSGVNNASTNNQQTDNPRPSTSNDISEHVEHSLGDMPDKPPTVFRHLEVISEGTKLIRKFNIHATALAFRFKLMDDDANPISGLKNGLNEIILHTSRGAAPSDRIGMTLRNANFADKPLGFSFRKVSQLSADAMLATIDKVLQINARFFAHDELHLHVDRISLPVGFGNNRLSMKGVSFEEFCRRKHSIIAINNSGNHCLSKALVVAIAWRRQDDNFELVGKGLPPLNELSTRLCHRAGVDLTNGGTLEHVAEFQSFLSEYTIVVYNHRLGKTVCYEGPRSDDRVVLNLLFENNHYNVIISLTGAFATEYLCELCRARSDHRNRHKNCPYLCPCCHDSPPCVKNNEMIACNICSRDFRGAACFNRHLLKQVCQQFKRCLTCYVTVPANSNHRCGYKRCYKCKSDQSIRHHCYMVRNKADVKLLNEKLHSYVFYDFECRQDTAFENTNNVFLHVPNLCVVQTVCNVCLSNDGMDQICYMCGVRQHVFREAPVEQLLNYLSDLAQHKAGCPVVALAHNMRSYDGHFILKAVLEDQPKWNPQIISTGTKIMSLTCNNIRFLDSLNFMPMPLANLPKTFGFNDAKGHFPHFFNTVENQNYVGPLPHSRYYGPDNMSSAGRKAFFRWYNAESEAGVVFDMQHDLVTYCVQDVNILRKATLSFSHQYFSENGVHPLKDSVATIASACMLVYRRNFLIPKTIGLIPRGGYRLGDRQSAAAIKWLLWVVHSEGARIQHAGTGREVRLPEGILVDGFCRETNTVYQFHGCYFHGCEQCFKDQTRPLSDRNKYGTMFARRENTEAVSARIRRLGYNLIETRECYFTNYVKRNHEAAAFLEHNIDIIKNTPLNPRDSFFGGRTNAVKLYHRAAPDEEICYYDVISLYPYVNKYGKYPIGHPKLYVGVNECRGVDLTTVTGLVKCCNLPPSNLYHPVLPLRLHGKLMFVLCKECGETLNQATCTHTQDERQFVGTYVADELRKAIELGYTIIEVYEIWEYAITKYDRDAKSGGLFSNYVNNFLKVKQESSGFPAWCVDTNTQDRYIQNYHAKEGVHLNKGDIGVNPGRRYNAKLCLNALWGKFGQRENLTKTSVISDAFEFFSLMTDLSKEVHSLVHISDEVIVVQWAHNEDGVEPLNTVNVAIAAYTTANARLVLYSFLEKLGRRVLYFDTDSVLFIKKTGEWAPPVGDFLGDMTDELPNTVPAVE